MKLKNFIRNVLEILAFIACIVVLFFVFIGICYTCVGRY